MGENNKKKTSIKIILFGFLLSFFIITITTPIHEAGHWIISGFDPYVEPIEFHIFDDKFLENGENILSSAFGYVIVKERYPGSFKLRPRWYDIFQELICIFIQLILTCFIVSKMLILFIEKKNVQLNLIKNIF